MCWARRWRSVQCWRLPSARGCSAMGSLRLCWCVLGVAIVGAGAARIHAEQKKTEAAAGGFGAAGGGEGCAEHGLPMDGSTYRTWAHSRRTATYEPDADVRARMTLVYSRAEELRWNRHDTMALTAMHIARFTGLPVVPYESLRAQPGEHLFVLYHTGWDWTDAGL